MAKHFKTDNHDPQKKLELRRYFLRKYHADKPPDVMDCCQGGGVLWRELRKEFAVASYWGLDLKPKKGRLKLDSVRVLQQPGWPQNVVDVDTYGDCWAHWEAMLPNIAKPTTVFLTRGHGGPNRITLSMYELIAIGITIPRIHKMGGGITHTLGGIAISYCLTKTCDYGNILVEAVEAVSDGNARYIGVRLQPQNGSGPVCQTEPQPQHPIDAKDQPHV